MPSPGAPRRVRWISLLVVPVAGLTLTTACGSHHPVARPVTSSTTASTASARTQPPPPAPTSPLTGRPGAPRPLFAVKVDNVGQGPQSGLNQADVVYCEQVEGGLTRLLVVFSSQTPTAVGPVRSARVSDLELLAQYGRIALVFSGANTGVLASVHKANIQDDSYDAHPALFHFDSQRVAPYKFLADIAAAARTAPGALAKDVGFRFGPAPAGGGTPIGSLRVSFPTTTMTATWSAASASWLMSRNGISLTQVDGSVASATDVLVQYVQISGSQYTDHNGNTTPVSATVGSGKAILLRAGRRYDATWRRATATAPTTWTAASGAPLTLAPGRTWVLLAPTNAPTQAG